MKQKIHKISAIFMSIVVLLSTMSFTFDKHFCGDMLVDTALFAKADTCGMEVVNQQKNRTECSITKKDCCSNKKVVVEGQKELKQSVDTLTFQQQIFIASFVYAYVTTFSELHNKVIPFQYYAPPQVIKDIHLLDEVFLI